LIPLLEERFHERTSAQWLKDLATAGVPCAPINDVASALSDEHTQARRLIVETDHPRFARIKQLSSPVRVGSVEPDNHRAPFRDDHAREILVDVANLTEDEIELFRVHGAFGALATD